MIDRLCLCATILMLALPLHAQVALEENQPETPIVRTSVSGLDLSELPDTDNADTTGFGVTLTGLRLIDSPDELRAASAARGVDASALAPLPGLNLAPLLQPYVGQPLSQRVLAALRRDIVQAHRDAGFAFVAVLLPEQEISNGSVQVLINRFRLGQTRVTGETRVPAETVASGLTLTPGALIDTNALTQDLAWANRNPFRNLRISAEPGDSFGQTDLTIRVDESRPFRFHAGLNNHGTTGTGEERAFIGLTALVPGTATHILSYQHTASQNGLLGLTDDSSFDPDAGAYSSHDLTYRFPIAPRLDAAIRVASIETREALTAPLISEQTTLVFSANLRRPLGLIGGFDTEAYGGLSAKRAERDLFFAGTPVSQAAIDVIQFEGGISGHRVTDTTSTHFSLGLAFSPGSLTERNNDADYVAFSGVPASTANFTILRGSIGQVWSLPQGSQIEANLRAQLASAAVPSTERFSIGGHDTVRGYATGEVSGDQGVVATASWHMPVLVDAPLDLSIGSFIDIGTVNSSGAGDATTLASTGVSLTGTFSDTAQMVFELGVPLRGGPNARQGDPMMSLSFVARF